MFDIVTKFTDYPSWVKVFVVLWVVLTFFLIMVQLFVKPTSKAKKQKQLITVDDLSAETKQELIDGLARKLLEAGEAGNDIFGIYKKQAIPNTVLKPKNRYVDWGSAKILKNSKDKVLIQFPYLKGDIGTNKGMTLSGMKTTLYKRVGDKQCPFNFGTEKFCAQVVGIEKDVVIVRITIENSN